MLPMAMTIEALAAQTAPAVLKNYIGGRWVESAGSELSLIHI
jgi:hypothetical protein